MPAPAHGLCGRSAKQQQLYIPEYGSNVAAGQVFCPGLWAFIALVFFAMLYSFVAAEQVTCSGFWASIAFVYCAAFAFTLYCTTLPVSAATVVFAVCWTTSI